MNNTEPSAADYDVVVVGDLNADLILSGNAVPVFGQVEKLVEDAALTLGSSAAIFACGVARLGLRVAFIGKVGTDMIGQFVVEQLVQHGIDVSGIVHDPSVKTGLSVILAHGEDRAILTYLGSIAQLAYHDIDPAILARSRHLHIASYFLLKSLQPEMVKLCNLAHEYKLRVSLDTNYDPDEQWTLGDLLNHVDIFLPNQTELCAIARKSDVDEALDTIAQQVPLVAVKLGAQGASARSSREHVHTRTIPVSVVDTTGAGDSFDAGFVYSYLQGWSMDKMLMFGSICGSLSTRAAGGTTAQPSLSEAIYMLEKLESAPTSN